MNYREAIEFLYKLRWFGTKLGLANTFKLAALAGNPQQKLRFIHVAGTNGKGSTCAMLESIYRAAGLRVGLFTSPHLVAFSERIQVNRLLIPEAEVVRQVTELERLLAQFPEGEHPTFFEVVTVMALRYFAAQNCDLVIWETGLGGRLDATNIVTPLASAITNIQFDHQQWLGDSLAAIASEKAGIIKPGIPILTTTDEPDALKVIRQTARAKDAPLTIVSPDDAVLNGIELSLLGHHQRLNAALAIAVVRALRPHIPVQDQTIRDGLSRVQWPGRLQMLTRPDGRKILLDGAHNAAGAGTLVAALREYFPAVPFALVLGVLGDKDVAEICNVLAPSASDIFITPVPSERSAAPARIAEACRRSNPLARVSEQSDLAQALVQSQDFPLTVVTGSLYLVGEALELFKGTQAAGERGLNEWGAVPKTEPVSQVK
jgi:dihydrofolate synthase/folylpolyglutamate synthase